MPRRVLGIDPGLTRCGYGVVDAGPALALVAVGVVRTPAEQELGTRLVRIMARLRELIDETEPEAIALERVFAQSNVNTVMGVAQISGLVIHEAAVRGIPLTLFTPSEVKAAVTGYGAADKRQVGEMVRRLLRLQETPKPADAADALAIAITAAWRGARATPAVPEQGGALTPAQRAWQEAERAARRR